MIFNNKKFGKFRNIFKLDIKGGTNKKKVFLLLVSGRSPNPTFIYYRPTLIMPGFLLRHEGGIAIL